MVAVVRYVKSFFAYTWGIDIPAYAFHVKGLLVPCMTEYRPGRIPLTEEASKERLVQALDVENWKALSY